MTALDEPAITVPALAWRVPVPIGLDDPAASWLAWVTCPGGARIGDDHPLVRLLAGDPALAVTGWDGSLLTGAQAWDVHAERVDDLVHVSARAALVSSVERSSSVLRDVTGRLLGSEELARADELFRETVDSLHQALYLYAPIWDEGRIVDLEIVYCNSAALRLPFTEEIVPGALASNVFKSPDLAMLEAEDAWEHGSTTPYSIERTGLVDGVERTIRYEIRTRRVGDHILQTSTDHTIADDLQRTEARQRLVLDALDEGVTLVAPVFDDQQRMVATRVLYANETAHRLRGTGVHVFVGATDGPELDATRRVWDDGLPQTDVVDRRDDARTSLYLELEVSRVGDLVLQVVRDRTDAVASAREKADSDQLFTRTIESLGEAVGIWDPVVADDGRVVDFRLRYANPSLARSLRPGTLATEVSEHVDVDTLAMGRGAMVLDGSPLTINLSLPTPTGPITWRTSVVAIGPRVVSVASDISEMQAVLGRLSASDTLLRSVLDSLTESVRVIGRHGRIDYANDASVALLGPAPEPSEDGAAPPYLVTDLDGEPLALDDYPMARGRRGETVSDLVVGVQQPGRERRICSVAVRPMYLPGDETPSRVVVSAHDISDISRHAAELEWLATHSRSTGLLNLDGFVHAVEQRTGHAGGSFALIWVVLHELDTIRPTFGFAAADAALLTAAERLAAVAERYSAVAAQPEDSAIVLLVPHVASGAQVQQIAAEVLADLARPFVSDSMSLLLGPVVGATIGPLHGNDAESLIRRSKTAAWHAHRTGLNFLRWRADLGAEQLERVSLVGEFDRALQDEEVFLEFQPKVDARTGLLVGAEALARWMHPTRGRIMPAKFIEGVEASALSRPFTLWAIRSALSQWGPMVARYPGSKVAVNVPVPLISDLEFMEQLADELVKLGTDPSWLQIEITERGLDGNVADIQAGLEQIAMLGIAVSLDDFGTGQSSLAFLRKLAINEVKVDRAFITNLQSDVANQAIVSACVSIARTGQMTVCAEGVETEDELATAAALGCDTVQGFLIGRPMSIASILARPIERPVDAPAA